MHFQPVVLWCLYGDLYRLGARYAWDNRREKIDFLWRIVTQNDCASLMGGNRMQKELTDAELCGYINLLDKTKFIVN